MYLSAFPMFCKDHPGETWSVNTLHRATRMGQQTYSRALSRKVEWPKPLPQHKPVQEDPAIYTSLDEAFSTMVQYMSQASRQCKRYYKSHPPREHEEAASCHCNRFHTQKYTAVPRNNPLQRSENVHVLVQPGSYTVSAGTWGQQQQQTHVVHVKQGESVDLDFVM